MNFRPKKSLGQNFLKNPRIIQKIIDTVELKGKELVVEVGPGMGVLTRELVKHAGRVIAIEKDLELYELLQEIKKSRNQENKNLTLIQGDALKIPPPTEPYMLVANIPYYITSPLLDHYIRDNPKNLPTRAVLLVQKEVAQKICAKPPDMNVLALHVQTFGTPKLIATVTKGNFYPAPKVDSAIIRIDFLCQHGELSFLSSHGLTGGSISLKADPRIGISPAGVYPVPRYGAEDDQRKKAENDQTEMMKKYFDLIHRAFSQKRKMLRSTLDEDLLKKAGIDATRRPETLTVEEWMLLSACVTVSGEA